VRVDSWHRRRKIGYKIPADEEILFLSKLTKVGHSGVFCWREEPRAPLSSPSPMIW